MDEVNKFPVSACILAKNEEKNLLECLPLLAQFAEVVVLDSGSEDQTVRVAEQFGAVVIQTDWEGFGKTRKRLFEEAKQPWIFWLDADERPTNDLLDEIRNCVETDHKEEGYEVNRLSYIGNKAVRHGDWHPDWTLRLFRRTAWTMEIREVHESVRVSGRPGRFYGKLIHYSYRDWKDRSIRAQRYAKLWASQAFLEGRRATVFDQVAHTAARFFRGYFLRLGFLDGMTGLRLALSNSAEVWSKYGRLIKAWSRFG